MTKQATPDFQKIIHDLRQPMATMRSFTRLLPQKSSHPEFLHDYEIHVQAALDKMESILVQFETSIHQNG